MMLIERRSRNPFKTGATLAFRAEDQHLLPLELMQGPLEKGDRSEENTRTTARLIRHSRLKRDRLSV